MILNYLTIAGSTRGLYKEKGSRFIAYAYPVTDQKNVKELMNRLQKEHHKARHHCYAYVLGAEGNDIRSHDDGEPKHSAGAPILGQIRALKLTNVLVVVVRYFGGTKLGISGLTKAYKEAARLALHKAKFEQKQLSEIWVFTFDYTLLNTVMRLVKDFELNIVEQHLREKCRIKLEVPLSIKEQVQQRVGTVRDVRFEAKK